MTSRTPKKEKFWILSPQRLDSLFAVSKPKQENIQIKPFLENILQEAQNDMGTRDLEITLRVDDDVQLLMDRSVLGKCYPAF